MHYTNCRRFEKIASL